MFGGGGEALVCQYGMEMEMFVFDVVLVCVVCSGPVV